MGCDWRGLPRDLELVVKDVRRKREEVESVSIGVDGDWFLRTNARHACKTDPIRAKSISNVEEFVLLIKTAGLILTQYAIQVFAFVPDKTGYVAVLQKTDGSLTQCAWHNVPPELDAVLEREAPNGVRHVTVGVNGSYVLILNSGVIWWGGVPVGLHKLLEDAERKRRPVATVSLSLVSTSWYFVEFEDGATDFSLPQGWHDSINSCTVQALSVRGHTPRMSTSFGPGVPQQEQQQQQQQQAPHHKQSILQKYNGMFNLLGDALNLAGAVLAPGSGLNL